MLASSRDRILEGLSDDAVVLDVGGGGRPFERADWVIDLLPYDDRGLYDYHVDEHKTAAERFSRETWVQRDMCDHEPWPFAEDTFDYAICSHTLEDVRDPIWVCAELSRVARAGYVEVPSRLEEQSFGFQGPWVGWGHHRWLIGVGDGEIEFVFKHHVIHHDPASRFPQGFQQRLTEDERVQTLFWTGEVRARERVFFDGPSLRAYLQPFVERHRDLHGPLPAADGSPPRPRWRRAAGALRRRAIGSRRGRLP